MGLLRSVHFFYSVELSKIFLFRYAISALVLYALADRLRQLSEPRLRQQTETGLSGNTQLISTNLLTLCHVNCIDSQF